MDTFLQNAQRIFDVACAETSDECSEFALLVRRDGGIHMIMESEITLSAVMAEADARTAYRVSRSPNGIRVTGTDGPRTCELEDRTMARSGSGLLRDQPLYRITSPLLISTAG